MKATACVYRAGERLTHEYGDLLPQTVFGDLSDLSVGMSKIPVHRRLLRALLVGSRPLPSTIRGDLAA